MTNPTAELEAEYDVVVVGAGPVGLFTAILLGQYGVRTLVVERRQEMYTYPRAIGIDDETMRALQAIGIAERQLPLLHFEPIIEYLSPVGYSRFQPPAVPGPYGHPFLATFLQPQLETGLRERLAELESVELREGIEFVAYDSRFDGDDCDATIVSLLRSTDGAELRTTSRFLLACDGARSRVRQQLGLDLVGDTQEEKWLVVDLRDDDVLSAAMTDRHEPCCAQPMVSITLPEGLRRIECRLGADLARADTVDDQQIRAALRPLVGDHRVDVVRAAVYVRSFRHAEQLREGGVFLLGDAAHLVPPYGGQGLCSGIRDAVNLAWKIALVLGGRLPTAVLDSYQAERGGHMALTVAFIRHLARRIEGDIDRAPDALEVSVADQRRAKPAPEFAVGFFDPTAGGGRMFPQPRVGSDGGTALMDDLLGQGFSVLARARSRVPAAHWRTLLGPETTVARISSPGADVEPESGVIVLDDIDGEVLAAMCEADVVVLRPDRFVLIAVADSEADRVAGCLNALAVTTGGVQ
ncbi:3-(3-hydroxy-phenyl)propionate hydroxylase [Rhodococcus sp. OK611]|jgi:3-(3-hydroxy-phenyl)propionate hydroxylase|uniref:FAD-dependent monooxygenase n=1 Tax=unclassified Rhodococcus (in: high G+C Gram-positive bacteria) TaxID=192944 RepID=UPI000BCC597A|nr:MULTISPECIES: FAD-dependent monooxygenase [unclassified Rhodococcus (in: high G+C Gram-positive bacteria)]PTR39019.1 3-(3-hydroxy-phenyl)propionate hydroxylase [Rhodococcus sp. OK611]SNX92805.1 3-(3-hydroxy-phenyl)propionate hydroxylase [Rhodococcus sp. OK270]